MEWKYQNRLTWSAIEMFSIGIKRVPRAEAKVKGPRMTPSRNQNDNLFQILKGSKYVFWLFIEDKFIVALVIILIIHVLFNYQHIQKVSQLAIVKQKSCHLLILSCGSYKFGNTVSVVSTLVSLIN